MGFPDGSAGKESTCNAGDLGSIPGLGRSPGRGNGNHSSIILSLIYLYEVGDHFEQIPNHNTHKVETDCN